ncbi:MAG: TonB-dependent receptor plug domain-containing protein, partial [Bacteroidota bacterium]
LLLNSDLPHPIQDAQSFFKDFAPTSQAKLDLILLTQGWRRFTWSDVLEQGEPALQFPNESGISFGGQITKAGLSGKPVTAEVIVMGFTEKLFMQRTLTEEDGLFYFSGFSFEDSIELSFQAGTYQRKKGSRRDPTAEQITLQPTGNRNVAIELFDYGWPEVLPLPAGKSRSNLEEQVLASIQADSARLASWEARYDKIKEISLDAVVIEGKKTEPAFTRFDRKDILYGQPDTRLILDSIPSARSARTIFDVIRARSPGVEILGPPGEKIVRIRGQSSINLANEALFLLDGAPVSTITANNLDIQRVDYIDIVRGLRATSVYGEAANGGIVAIFTKAAYEPNEGREIQEPGVLKISHPGYYQAREFYVPPRAKQNTSPLLEPRNTLYWESDLTLDQNGQAKVSFPGSNQAGTYLIVVQGLSADAQPFYSTKSIEIQP